MIAIIIICDVRLFGKDPNKQNEECNRKDINFEKITNHISNHYYLPSKLCEKDSVILHTKHA